MKKLVLSALAVGALFAQSTSTDLEAKIKQLEAQIKELKQIALSNQKKVNPIAANNHLYWQYRLQTNADFIQYKLVGGDKKSNNVFTNKVLLTGVAKPSENLKATLRIEAYNIFGMDGNPYAMLQNNNALASETPDDTGIRVRDAFFNYNFGPDNGLMFSAGRRPATEGFPANLRNNDNPNSPLAHLINMEFDGFSFEISNTIFSKLSDKFSDWGTWLKFCAGRGYAPNDGYFSPTPYARPDNDKIEDFAGFIFVPYDDGQYSLKTEVVKAWNVRGLATQPTPTMNPQTMMQNMKPLGGYFGFNAIFTANGIGDDSFESEALNDFLDNTVAFVSFAMSRTLPSSGEQMLGSPDSKVGKSIWIGAQMPADSDGIDNWGFNFVRGSKYWRSMTYGEDTLIGSIAAVRGTAFELYYNHQIIPHLTCGIRGTMIKYDYTGSNAFFGYDGMPIDVDSATAQAMAAQQGFNIVKDAKDLRIYIRYDF
jgi:hypothetical protein